MRDPAQYKRRATGPSSSGTIFLRFTPAGGGTVATVMLRDPAMFWLPRGEFQVSVTVLGNPGTLPVMAGAVDLSKAPL